MRNAVPGRSESSLSMPTRYDKCPKQPNVPLERRRKSAGLMIKSIKTAMYMERYGAWAGGRGARGSASEAANAHH